jgi:hypothetical protein
MADDRYQREIDELLKRLERQHQEPLIFRLRRRASPWQSMWRRGYQLVGGHSAVERLVLIAVVFLGLTLLLGLFDSRLALTSAVLSVAALMAALVVSIGEGATGNRPAPRHERGLYPHPGSALDWGSLSWRLRRWWRRFRR